jgi:hypothetical protein
VTRSQWVGAAVLVALWCRVLAVDVAGIVTNDSVGYLQRSINPLSYGFVVQGYRQAAYPLLIHIASWFGDVTGLDTIFSVALLQRMMLLLGIALVWGALRWWALPALLVVTSATFVVHADLVLTEGFLIPACVIIAGLAASVVTARGFGSRHPMAALIIATSLATAMGAVKLQYAATLLLAAAIGWLVVRDGTVVKKTTVIVLAAGAVFIGALTAAQTVENHQELGVWEPVSEQVRAEWYGGWQAIFAVHKENRAKPELAAYFNGGNLYTFLYDVEATQPDYPTRAKIIRARVSAMFAAAGTTEREQSLASFVGAVKGGRTDDIASIVGGSVSDEPGLRERRLSFNHLSREGGPDLVYARVNEGERAHVLEGSNAFGGLQSWYDDYRRHRSFIGVVSALLVLASLAFRGRHRSFALASTLTVGGICGVLASAYIDNARYLMGPMAISMVGAALAARAITGAAWSKWKDTNEQEI